jgi:ubiquinone/menaquinone biosynthesis C-methylase UbiE
MTDSATRRLVTELFASQGWPAGGDELLQRSLGPRAPEVLLEAPGRLGLEAGQLVLDAGCRDATHPIALARRYGCRVVGVDLVPAWLPGGLADAAAAGLADRVALVQGDLEALPVADGACDLVWCRDTLSCVGDCARMLAECARVLRPGGAMVLYAVFATDELAPADRALVVEGLHNSPSSMHQPTVEAAIAATGFEVEWRERIGSEWTEHQLERDPGHLTQDLLEVARLTRARDQLEPALGPAWYRRALGFASWRPQILLGRLVPVLYGLRRPALRHSAGGGRATHHDRPAQPGAGEEPGVLPAHSRLGAGDGPRLDREPGRPVR